MAAHSVPGPGPDEPRSLTPREREILASIEDALSATDPALARHLASRLPGSSSASQRRLLKGGRLIAGPLIVIMVLVLVPPQVWLFIALLTLLLVVPWVILRAIERGDPD